MRKILAILLSAALCLTLFAGFGASSAAAEVNNVGSAETEITLLPSDGTPSEEPDASSSNPFAINTTHDVSYWNFGGGGNGRYVSYVFDAPVSGDYYLAINYNTKNTRTLKVTANGTSHNVSFVRNSYSWGNSANAVEVNWSYTVTKVALVKGSNTLTIGMDGTSNAPMYSDLKLWPASEWLTSADACVVTGKDPIVIDCASGFDGKAFDPGNVASTITWNVYVPIPGTYKLIVPYSCNYTGARAFSVSVNEEEVAVFNQSRPGTTYNYNSQKGAYGDAWGFVTSGEFSLNVGESVPVTLHCQSGVYLGGVRLELVESALPEDQIKDLTVSYAGEQASGEVYSLDILWENDDFTFDYSAGKQGDWNPQDHTFGTITEAGWKDPDLKVTVVNHSNAAVKVTMDITDGDAADGLTVTSDKATETLATAEGTAVADAPKVEYTLTIDGTPTESVTKVATATLTFAEAE